MEKSERVGIIDTISLGYGLINRQPWLLAIPIVLDLFLWFGPRLSAREPLEALIARLAAPTGDAASEAAVWENLQRMAENSDLFDLLGIQVPSLVRALNPSSLPFAEGRMVINVTEVGTAIWLSLLLLALGLGLMAAYMLPIAQLVRSGRVEILTIGADLGRAWLRLLLLVLLLVGAILAVAVPLSLLAALFSLVGVDIVLLLVFVLQVAVIWLLIYLYFVPEAILVSNVGPVQGIRNSIALVRQNFWPALGLIAVTLLITAGLAIIFEAIAANPIGLPLAIAAHAYIGSGLVAAGMIFYRDRFVRSSPSPNPGAVSQAGPGARR